MKIAASIAVGILYVLGATCEAQEAAGSDTPAAAPTELNEIEAEAPELTRAERRALRRAEREAEAPARVADTETVAAVEEAEAEADDEGIICRREAVTGSHRRIRICTTRAEREAMRQSARETLQDVSRTRGFGPEGSVAPQ